MEQKTETAIIIIIIAVVVVVIAIAAVLADDCGFWHEIERLTRDDNQAAGRRRSGRLPRLQLATCTTTGETRYTYVDLPASRIEYIRH